VRTGEQESAFSGNAVTHTKISETSTKALRLEISTVRRSGAMLCSLTLTPIGGGVGNLDHHDGGGGGDFERCRTQTGSKPSARMTMTRGRGQDQTCPDSRIDTRTRYTARRSRERVAVDPEFGRSRLISPFRHGDIEEGAMIWPPTDNGRLWSWYGLFLERVLTAAFEAAPCQTINNPRR